MNTVFLILIFICSIISCNAQSQELKGFFEIEVSHLEKLQIKTDNDLKFYHKDTIRFIPTGDYSFCIYEVFADKFIIITPIVGEENRLSSAIYMFAKNEIKIYSLTSCRLYDANLETKEILEIDEDKKQVVVLNFKNEREILDFK